MRLFVIWISLLLVGSGLAYSAQRGQAPFFEEPRTRAAAIKAVADSKPLFYSLGSDVTTAGIRQVRFLVKVSSRPFLRETITVPAGQAAGSTLELLAERPDLLDRLYLMSESKEQKVTVSISGDGRELKTFSFQELVTYNRRIKTTTRLRLQPQKSEVEILDPDVVGASPAIGGGQPAISAKSEGWHLDQNCVNWCEAQRTDCVASGGCGDMRSCDPCNEQYDTCVSSNCWVWVCSDPKSQTTSNQAVPVNAYWYGQSCLDDIFNDREWFDRFLIVYKIYQVTHTEYCNGSSSDSSVYLYDYYYYCDRPTGFSCAYSSGVTYNICY